MRPKYGKQESLLSRPPQSKGSIAVKVPDAVQSSSAPIVNTISHFSKLIIYCYIIFGVASVIMTILELVSFNKVALFAIMIFGTILLSFGGALGVYKWGTVEMQIDRFKGENAKFESSIQALHSTELRLVDAVKRIDQNVSGLSKSADDLKKNLKEYDKLREDLEEIAGDNQTLNDMINEINGMYDGMKSAVIQNQRSSILQIFYEVQWKDNDQGLSKREYNRFKGRLDKETRHRFEQHGSFEQLAGADGVIDLAEFSDLMEQILVEMEEESIRKHTSI